MTRSHAMVLVGLGSISCSDVSVGKFNASPTAEITSHTDLSDASEGYVESFRGVVSDPDHAGEDLTTSWYLDGELMCESAPADADGVSLCDMVMTANFNSDVLRAVAEVVLEVQDPMNSVDSDLVTLSVRQTFSPSALIISPTADDVYYDDQPVTFEGVVGDSEDVATDLLASWESSQDGELAVTAEPGEDGTVTGTGTLTEGEHTIQLNVVDTTGKTGSATVSIVVGPSNTSPSCGITAPASGTTGEEGQEVVFEATVEDAEIPA
ncbi:MAG: hypothetical protein QGG40_09230, partial [Myxococcota bacterium]|nr:hypothetical protein [Myxococcota bacterium]